jgi:hypothetical protein
MRGVVLLLSCSLHSLPVSASPSEKVIQEELKAVEHDMIRALDVLEFWREQALTLRHRPEPSTHASSTQVGHAWRPVCITREGSAGCHKWRERAGWPFCHPYQHRLPAFIRGRVPVPCNTSDSADPSAPGAAHAHPTRTGAWQLGAGYHYKIELTLAIALSALFGNASVVELGAGLGCYSAWLRDDRGMPEDQANVWAFDGAPGVAERTRGLVQHADLTSPTLMLPRADWVLCLEVAEHIPIPFEDIFLTHVLNSSKRGLVLSWSEGDGLAHVNKRGSTYVIRRITERGFTFDARETSHLRSVAQDFRWFQGTSLHVFYRSR